MSEFKIKSTTEIVINLSKRARKRTKLSLRQLVAVFLLEKLITILRGG
jgi:hypothetical protein